MWHIMKMGSVRLDWLTEAENCLLRASLDNIKLFGEKAKTTGVYILFIKIMIYVSIWSAVDLKLKHT